MGTGRDEKAPGKEKEMTPLPRIRIAAMLPDKTKADRV